MNLIRLLIPVTMAALALPAFCDTMKYKRCPNNCNTDGEVPVTVKCAKCGGKGKFTCPTCKNESRCKDCGGTGKIVQMANGKKKMMKCPVCGGAGRVEASQYVKAQKKAKSLKQ